MTVDPYMRGRMNDVKSYSPPFQLGEAMQGGAVGTVIASNDPAFNQGDPVQSFMGWREAFNAPAGHGAEAGDPRPAAPGLSSASPACRA